MPVPVQFLDKEQFSLTNLALELGREPGLGGIAEVDGWKVWDEHNRYELTIGEVKALIRSEPNKPPPPLDDEYPEDAGAITVKTPEEADEIISHLDAALAALNDWSNTFDWTQLVPDLSAMPS